MGKENIVNIDEEYSQEGDRNLVYSLGECGLANIGGMIPPKRETRKGKELDGGISLGDRKGKTEGKFTGPIKIGYI